MLRSMNSDGIGLVETMFAVLVSLVTLASLGTALVEVAAMDKNEGQEATRATIYAQDKIEALLALNFTNCTQPASAQPASCNSTGISGTGWTQGLLSGGQIDSVQQACPSSGSSVGYVDYLDASGTQMAGSSCSVLTSTSGTVPAYIRQWEISDLPTSGAAIKRISVAVYSMQQVNGNKAAPLVVLTSVLSQ